MDELAVRYRVYKYVNIALFLIETIGRLPVYIAEIMTERGSKALVAKMAANVLIFTKPPNESVRRRKDRLPLESEKTSVGEPNRGSAPDAPSWSSDGRGGS